MQVLIPAARTLFGGVLDDLPDAVAHLAEDAADLWVQPVHQHHVDRRTDVPQHQAPDLLRVYRAAQADLQTVESVSGRIKAAFQG